MWRRVRDLHAFLFSLRGTEKRNQGIRQVCALAHAQAPGLCGHDSNPEPIIQKAPAGRQELFVWRRVRDLNPSTGVTGLRDFECCLSLADTRLEQVVTGSLVKCRKPRRRKGLRTFRPVSARGDSNRPKVQIKPRSCVKCRRSCAFARSQARKQRPRQHR